MSAIPFDREQVEHLDDLPKQPERLNGSRLLWVGINRGGAASVEKVDQAFDLED